MELLCEHEAIVNNESHIKIQRIFFLSYDLMEI